MDVDNPKGVYRTNTLARINVCDFIDTPLAQAELEEFRAKFGRPAQLTLLYHWARLIELLYNAENAIRLLDDPEITSTETRVKCYAAGSARHRRHRSAARHAHPRLHHRCQRPGHQRQPDRRHHPQQRSHQYVGHTSRQEFD